MKMQIITWYSTNQDKRRHKIGLVGHTIQHIKQLYQQQSVRKKKKKKEKKNLSQQGITR